MKNISSSKEMRHTRKKFIRQKKLSIKNFLHGERKIIMQTNSTNTKKKCASLFLQVIKACSRVLFFERKEKDMDVI